MSNQVKTSILRSSSNSNFESSQNLNIRSSWNFNFKSSLNLNVKLSRKLNFKINSKFYFRLNFLNPIYNFNSHKKFAIFFCNRAKTLSNITRLEYRSSFDIHSLYCQSRSPRLESSSSAPFPLDGTRWFEYSIANSEIEARRHSKDSVAPRITW